MNSSAQRPRRWLQFRLRTLLVLIAVAAAPLAWLAKERRQSHYEQTLASVLNEQGLDVTFGGPYDVWDYDALNFNKITTPQSRWREIGRTILGDRILEVHRFDPESTFNDTAAIAGIANLQSLNLGDLAIEDLRPLSAHKRLKMLSLIDTNVDDLTPLAHLTELKFLLLNGTEVSDLKPLAGLSSLQELSLNDTVVTDLTPLGSLKQLKHISVMDSLVTKWDVDYLKTALPDCYIEHGPVH